MTPTPATAILTVDGRDYDYVPIAKLPGVETLPFSLKVLLENLCRQAARGEDVGDQIGALLARRVGAAISFRPTRIFGQDILGLVMMVDIAGLRDAVAEAGGDPARVQPSVPIDIIIDHSLQVDRWASPDAPRVNLAREYQRNGERFAFLRWCAESFEGVRVVPPGKGIMHQIHIERIGQVVWCDEGEPRPMLSPDTCVGTDSHTPMVNGLGILGWGVGGIEAEAVMVGKPVAMALPEVIGVEVTGRMPAGTTPTDLVLTITERLRAIGVVGRFVEFFGPGLEALTVGDRATIANMAPEYGATAVYFPVDAATEAYLWMTGRTPEQIARIRAYCEAQGLWRDATTPAPQFDRVIPLDLSEIRPCIAGPKNPEDRIALPEAPAAFPGHVAEIAGRPMSDARVPVAGEGFGLGDGDIVIAAITSCTNTSSPEGIATAGLLAKNAVARGLEVKPWVKTSFAPGSQVVAEVLDKTGLQPSLDALGFHIVGFGCTTCNGGSGPLPQPLADAIEGGKLVSTAVLSGNRNFQGRIHPNVRAAYLASPALVIAHALAGTMRANIASDPLGHDKDGNPVRLADLWPSPDEVTEVIREGYGPKLFTDSYASLYEGGAPWEALKMPGLVRFPWREDSTYLQRPPWFDGLPAKADPPSAITGIRPLVLLGDSITTDHISPSGAISLGTPTADWLLEHGVPQHEFNNYTTRRGNHHAMVRATFANIRLRNAMVPEREGPFTRLMPDGTVMRVFEASQEYGRRGVPLAVLAGKNYGAGSSRDSAAKGPALLGVKAIIAQGFERIHRTNLVGMGVLPLAFDEGTDWRTLGMDGSEVIDLPDLTGIGVLSRIPCVIRRADGSSVEIGLAARLETGEDVDYWKNGGIMPTVWREMVGAAA
ncbi:aconitate hydratase AcnA [Paracoccus sp. S-4012]|uniref:aconitate hydratase AcnA n=1 Tax=Paracoccus sp. S-4012 TaxID=2665648 RepID=UPI0012B0E277|nr:aconitate hydratase AcnA [Paracoccus sp. S-4012]MRX48943.1 aconitate hydratase AcnA [Paracoccus sp. S-4012]